MAGRFPFLKGLILMFIHKKYFFIFCYIQRGAWEETPGGGGRGGETPGATPSARVWDATPGHITPGHATPGRETPAQHASRRNRWDETPKTDRGNYILVRTSLLLL